MKQFLTYNEGKKVTRKNKVKDSFEYQKLRKKFPKLPSEPQVTWKKQWNGFYELLGTRHHRIRFIVKFDKAKKMNKKLKITSRKDYLSKRLDSMPASPSDYYKKQWNGWGDYLGLDIISSKLRVFVSYEKCKKYVYKNKIKSLKELREWSKAGKKPNNIPCQPESIYKNKGWEGSKKFFAKEWLSYDEAMEVLRPYNLQSQDEFVEFIHKNPQLNIPVSPERIYKEWRSN